MELGNQALIALFLWIISMIPSSKICVWKHTINIWVAITTKGRSWFCHWHCIATYWDVVSLVGDLVKISKLWFHELALIGNIYQNTSLFFRLALHLCKQINNQEAFFYNLFLAGGRVDVRPSRSASKQVNARKVCIEKCSKIRKTHLQETKMFERSSIFNSPKEHIAHSDNHLQHTASPNFTSPNPL